MQRTPYSDDQDQETQNKSLNPEEIKLVREYYTEGFSLSKLTTWFDVSRSTIYRIVSYQVYSDIASEYTSECLNQLNKNRGGRPRELNQFKVQLAYYYGLNVSQLADEFKCSRRTIYRYLR